MMGCKHKLFNMFLIAVCHLTVIVTMISLFNDNTNRRVIAVNKRDPGVLNLTAVALVVCPSYNLEKKNSCYIRSIWSRIAEVQKIRVSKSGIYVLRKGHVSTPCLIYISSSGSFFSVSLISELLSASLNISGRDFNNNSCECSILYTISIRSYRDKHREVFIFLQVNIKSDLKSSHLSLMVGMLRNISNISQRLGLFLANSLNSNAAGSIYVWTKKAEQDEIQLGIKQCAGRGFIKCGVSYGYSGTVEIQVPTYS
jgi:hypothetical protein